MAEASRILARLTDGCALSGISHVRCLSAMPEAWLCRCGLTLFRSSVLQKTEIRASGGRA